MEDILVHTESGELVSKFDIPGTKVKRKQNLPYKVNNRFPLGEVKTIGPPCNRINEYQDPDREFCHIFIPAEQFVDVHGHVVGNCFHAYRDTLEIVDE